MAAPPLPGTLTPGQAARRDRCIDAGLALLADHRYEDIQVKDVADAAGVALGTLYRYFPSKDHLFAEVLLRWVSGLRTSVTTRPVPDGSPADRLSEVFRRGVRAFQKQPQVARLVATLQLSSDPRAAQLLEASDESVRDVYLGALDGIPRDRAEAVIRVVHSVYSTNLRAWALGRAPAEQLQRRIDEAIDLLLRAPAADGTGGRPQTSIVRTS